VARFLLLPVVILMVFRSGGFLRPGADAGGRDRADGQRIKRVELSLRIPVRGAGTSWTG